MWGGKEKKSSGGVSVLVTCLIPSLLLPSFTFSTSTMLCGCSILVRSTPGVHRVGVFVGTVTIRIAWWFSWDRAGGRVVYGRQKYAFRGVFDRDLVGERGGRRNGHHRL